MNDLNQSWGKLSLLALFDPLSYIITMITKTIISDVESVNNDKIFL